MLTLELLKNKKVIAFRGISYSSLTLEIPLNYILFDDEETVLELADESDSYQDCSRTARELRVFVDKDYWKNLFENTKETTKFNLW